MTLSEGFLARLEKVLELQKRSEGGEAEAAAEAAARILAREGLDMAAARAALDRRRADNERFRWYEIAITGDWQHYLLCRVAEVFGCRGFRIPRGPGLIFGDAETAEAVAYLFRRLAAAVEIGAGFRWRCYGKEEARLSAAYGGPLIVARDWKASYRMAACQAIWLRLKAGRDLEVEAYTNGSALVSLEESALLLALQRSTNGTLGPTKTVKVRDAGHSARWGAYDGERTRVWEEVGSGAGGAGS